MTTGAALGGRELGAPTLHPRRVVRGLSLPRWFPYCLSDVQTSIGTTSTRNYYLRRGLTNG